MESQVAVVWSVDGADRFVGKLALSEDEMILDGTTPTPDRRRDRVHIPRADIHRATAERVDGATVIRIATLGGVYLVQPVADGRGPALSLVDELSHQPR